MKMKDIIKERRLLKNMTQEQMAKLLGVSTPAVNKWERGGSYPDITLLPALARLLDTDLNTLLSFQDDLSAQEIGLFLNEISELSEKEGLEKAFEAAKEKIKEFPTCYALLLNTAFLLEGMYLLSPTANRRPDGFEAYIVSLLERVLCSEDAALRNQAQSALISKYMERKEYEKAEALLGRLPEKNPVDKKQIQIKLNIAYGKLEEAARLEEEKLLSTVNELESILMILLEIALKQGRKEDAAAIAEVSGKAAKLFDLWEYISYAAPFEYYTKEKNREKSMEILTAMVQSLAKEWKINRSPLYRHIKTKESDFIPKFSKTLQRSIREDEQTAFLKNDPAFLKLMETIELL